MSDDNNAISKEQLKDGDARTLIQEMGGIRPLAKKLGLSASTVQGWYERNNIPAKRVETILSMYDESSEKGDIISTTEETHHDEDSDAQQQYQLPASHDSSVKDSRQATVSPSHNIAIFLSIIAIIAVITRPYYANMIDPYLIGLKTQNTNTANSMMANLEHDHDDMQQQINRINNELSNIVTISEKNITPTVIDIKPLQQQISQLQKELSIIKKQPAPTPIIPPAVQEFDENQMLERLREKIEQETNALQEKFSQNFNRIETEIDQELKLLGNDNNQQALRSLRQEFNENLSLAHHIITTAQLNALFAQPQMMRNALLSIKKQSAQHPELQQLIDDAIDLAHRPVYSKAMLHDQMTILIDELRVLPLQDKRANLMDKLKATLAQLVTIRRTNYVDGAHPIDILVMFNESKDLQQLMLAAEGFTNIYPPMAQWLKDADFHIQRHQLSQRLSQYMQALFADNKAS